MNLAMSNEPHHWNSPFLAHEGSFVLEGKYLWDLKDWIDRKWMWAYTDGIPLMDAEGTDQSTNAVAQSIGEKALAALAESPMRCGGCGAKVGETTLRNGMQRLKGFFAPKPVPTRSEVVVGLDHPDDCAIVRVGKSLSVQTVDFFRAFYEGLIHSPITQPITHLPTD